MKKTLNQNDLIKAEEYLNERYMITKMDCAGPADESYLKGAVKMLETLGFEVVKEGEAFKVYPL